MGTHWINAIEINYSDIFRSCPFSFQPIMLFVTRNDCSVQGRQPPLLPWPPFHLSRQQLPNQLPQTPQATQQLLPLQTTPSTASVNCVGVWRNSPATMPRPKSLVTTLAKAVMEVRDGWCVCPSCRTDGLVVCC